MADWPAGSRDRVASAPAARLATVGPDGAPHVVPITFAVVDPWPAEGGERLVTAVDHKPKRSRSLRRLANIDHDARVSILIDHYDHDWARLWWVRIDGDAEVVAGESPAGAAAIDALVARYAQYREDRPSGPAIVVAPRRVVYWRADTR